MNDNKVVLYVFLYHAVISEVSLSLGLTSNVLSRANAPIIAEEIGAFEALWVAITMVLNNLFSFVQLMTLQADIPYIFSIFLIYPTSLLMLFIIIKMIRG